MDGILIIDKPAGMTSHDVVQETRNLLGLSRVGHAGTLDPFATGILIILVGEATKLSQILINDDKVYVATVHIGIETDSGDKTGEIVAEKYFDYLEKEKVFNSLQKFIGKIDQLPPMFSAKKQFGIPLYKLARRGEVIERDFKKIEIYNIKILDFNPPEMTIEIHCSKGTYIRVLAIDFGKDIGMGAHLKELRRIKSGSFTIEDAVKLNELLALDRNAIIEKKLIPINDVMEKIRSYPI